MSNVKTAAALRSSFLNYFKKQGHEVVESSSLVPHNDPTLLFTTAGMVQFKDCFLGADPRPYTRATTAQRCVRAGGKHNDLENVGFTARHHTFFEMLGNFSFGDYFKKDAIHFAWEFLTKDLGLDKSKLHVSVFREDDEAAEIWHKQEGVPLDHIFRMDEKDNFWAAGDTGPCGPCSEIYVDRGMKYSNGDPNEKAGDDGDRFMEIWNLVFMQYDRDASGKLNPLKKPSIDTGMGLERLTSVIQGVDTNYDTDIFQSIIAEISKLSGVKYLSNSKTDASMRVIADHLRATNFLIADGVLPSNEGRGYVLRRIMRRAIRHGRGLGFNEPFFYKLTPALIQAMGDAYPIIKTQRESLQSNVKLEEERFLQTLDSGMKILDEAMAKSSGKKIAGDIAFKLYDTFGFPLDLTQVIAKEHNHTVDEAGFNKSMEEQRSRSRDSWKGSGDSSIEGVWKDLHQKGLKTSFKGYDALEATGKVLAIVEEGKVVDKSSTGSFNIVVDQTPFYAESGGQSGDHGTVKSGSFSAKVTDTQKPMGELFAIHVEGAQGSLKVGDSLSQTTDKKLRSLTAKNHTATHMLHHALRKFLGEHVRQAGSIVSPELLRFDFTHTKPMTDSEIEKIEDYINDWILNGEPVAKEEMDKDAAMKKGAIAFFGDKYGARVRVITVGKDSVEFCGGTHVNNTSDIAAFKVVNESGIAAGVRRIVAVTGPAIVQKLREAETLVSSVMDQLHVSAPAEIGGKLEKLVASEKELRKAVEAGNRKAAAGSVDQWIESGKVVKDGKFISAIVDVPEGETPAKILRDLSDVIRSKVAKAVVALAAKDKAKNTSALLVAVTKEWQSTYDAGKIVKAVAPILEGTGGGKADMAQAGGKNFKFDEAFAAISGSL